MSLAAKSIAVIALLGLAGCGYLLPHGHQTTEVASLPEGTFRLDPNHATLLFKINHLGFSQLVGRFNQFDATLDFDPADAEASKLTVLIDTASIDLGLPSFEEELRGSSWFDVERYPEARFESESIAITSDNTGTVTGDLTLRGVTAPVTLDVTFNGGGSNILTGAYTLGFAAEGTLLRSTFGLGSFAPAIGDEVTLEIHAEFAQTSPGA